MNYFGVMALLGSAIDEVREGAKDAEAIVEIPSAACSYFSFSGLGWRQK